MKRILSWLMLCALSACAGQPTLPTPDTRNTLQMRAFNLNGRIAVRVNTTKQSAGFYWQHQSGRDELLLQGPLGITGARIVSMPDAATMDSHGRHYAAQNVELLMQQVLGWSLPVPLLQHWMQARADPALPSEISRDAMGRISVLQQAGWQIRYLRYADPAIHSLPARIELERADMQLQVLLDEWEWL